MKRYLIGLLLLGACGCAHSPTTASRAMDLPETAPEKVVESMSLQMRLFSIDSQIADKKAQINHFNFMDDNLWDGQIQILENEISALEAEKTRIESELIVLR